MTVLSSMKDEQNVDSIIVLRVDEALESKSDVFVVGLCINQV